MRKRFLSRLFIAIGFVLFVAAAGVVSTQVSSVLIGTCRASSGSGSPESTIVGKVCDLYLRTDGASGTVLYVKASGTGNTGWEVAGSGGGGGGGGGGDLVLLQSQTASASATLDFTTPFSSTYDHYVVTLENVVPATTNTDFYYRLSTDGGATWDSTAKYVQSTWAWTSAGTGTAGELVTAPTTQFAVRRNLEMATTAAYGVTGTIHLHTSSGVYTRVESDIAHLTTTDALAGSTTRGVYQSTTTANGLRFFFSSGNIASGTIRVYGVAKTASAASAGDLVLVESHTASTSAALDFTSVTSTYDTYLFEVTGVVPVTDGAILRLQVSTDGGATFESTNYRYANRFINQANFTGANVSASAPDVFIMGTLENTAANGGGMATVRLSNVNSTTEHKFILGSTMFAANDTNHYQADIGGVWQGTAAINAVRFSMNSGNIASGTIRMYGLAK